MTDDKSLTFARLREVNLRRCTAPRPQGFEHPLEMWSPFEWAGAVCGEAGEAANKAKKFSRISLYENPEVARQLNKDEDVDLRSVVKEVADAVIYADLLAARCGMTLEEAVLESFNNKSREIGSDLFL